MILPQAHDECADLESLSLLLDECESTNIREMKMLPHCRLRWS